jgi:1-acyl-sn-glycerol-3-phosphate acyltransferase
MKDNFPLFSVARGTVKIAVFLIAIGLFIPFALIHRRIWPHNVFNIVTRFHRFLLWLLNITVYKQGVIATTPPVFFVANHTSYLDILILGSLLPASFVAKAEVASWPLFGYLSRLQNTLYIERRSTRAAAQRSQLTQHLADKKSLILFPEGTSSDGLAVLPFKSSLFSIVDEAPHAVTIQPVSVTCTAFRGRPLSLVERDLFAWYGEMTLTPHLWAMFKTGGFTVQVVFHPPVSPDEFENRKMLAAACQEKVAFGITQSLSEIKA